MASLLITQYYLTGTQAIATDTTWTISMSTALPSGSIYTWTGCGNNEIQE